MIKADFHVHSNFSSDADTRMEDMVEKAISLGIEKLCFTDHIDYDYPTFEGGHTFVFELDKYFKKLNSIKEEYSSKIKIYKGVECGIQTHIIKELKNLENYNFDFIIGSSHVIDGLDPYYPNYWLDRDEEEGVIKYFQSIIDNCKYFDGFHVYGHLDYIFRYTPVVHKKYPYEKYSDIIDEVLKTIIDEGKGIELNTSGYKYIFNHPHPRIEILKRYKEMGGEIITIGSDAHEAKYLAYGFDKAASLLKEIGYKYYTIFEKGKPIFEKL